MDRDKVSAFSSRQAFDGFSTADFAAYEPQKWCSNAYTLARRTAKDKLLIVAHALEHELKEELQSLDLHGSDEAPTIANGRKVEAQWAFFVRDPQTRSVLKPRLQKTDLGAASLFDIALQSQHIALSIRVNAQGISVSIDMPTKATVDRENLSIIFSEASEREAVTDLLRGLPGGSTIGFEVERKDVLSLEPNYLTEFTEQLKQFDSAFSIATLISKEDALGASAALIGTIVEMATSYVPIYRRLAWSEENDHLELLKDLKQVEKSQLEAHASSFQVGDRVTILSGLFSGRMGYLQEISAGKAKVMVGPIAVNLEAKDLKPN